MIDVSYIATSTSCKFYVKRTTNNLNQIDIVGYSTSIHNVYDRSYNQNYVAPAIGSSTIILLYNQAWYELKYFFIIINFISFINLYLIMPKKSGLEAIQNNDMVNFYNHKNEAIHH